jgi:DNA-binding MarR family transcriptional regulator
VPEDVERAEPNLGVLLFLPYRAMEQRVFSELARLGFDDITPAQGRLFARIADDGSRITDLAEQAQVTKQTAGFLVDQLERAGYVDRVPDPTDGRARLVRIAPRGRKAVRASARVVAAVEREWEDHLGSDGVETLRALLHRLREVTDPWA